MQQLQPGRGTLHAKVSNRRKDFLHKLSTQQARESAAMFGGDVNSKALARTRMAKSVLVRGLERVSGHALVQVR